MTVASGSVFDPRRRIAAISNDRSASGGSITQVELRRITLRTSSRDRQYASTTFDGGETREKVRQCRGDTALQAKRSQRLVDDAIEPAIQRYEQVASGQIGIQRQFTAIPTGRVFTCVYGGGLMRVRDTDGAITDIDVGDAHPAGCAVDPLARWDVIVTGTEHGTLMGITL